jgi:hypothetical protein
VNTCGGNAGGGRARLAEVAVAAIRWRSRRRFPQLLAGQQHVRVCSRAHICISSRSRQKTRFKLTTDGAKYYSFGARDTLQERMQQELTRQQQATQQDDQQDDENGGGRQGAVNRDPRVRANVIWSPDSKSFAVTRTDQRKVGELFLVNNTANPRPTLMSYSYAMPGEENVGQQELFVFNGGDTKLTPMNLKRWKDQQLYDITGTEAPTSFAWCGAIARSALRADRSRHGHEGDRVDSARGHREQLERAPECSLRDEGRRLHLVVGALRVGPLLPV